MMENQFPDREIGILVGVATMVLAIELQSAGHRSFEPMRIKQIL